MVSWDLGDPVSDDSLEQFSELGCLVDEGLGLEPSSLRPLGQHPLSWNGTDLVVLGCHFSEFLVKGGRGDITRLIFEAATQYIHLEKYAGGEFRGEVFPHL